MVGDVVQPLEVLSERMVPESDEASRARCYRPTCYLLDFLIVAPRVLVDFEHSLLSLVQTRWH